MFRLLCITAHPDDEAGAFGGTLALYAERGVEISVVCLTAGTAAKNRGSARSDEELATLRTAELKLSCEFLGVKHCEVLNYPDSKLDRANFYEVAGDLAARVRRFQPHVVITFGTDGGLTGHLDHAMAGAFATQAFQWAGRPDRYPEQLAKGLKPHRTQKLYWVTANFLLPDRMKMSVAVVFVPGDLVQFAIRLFGRSGAGRVLPFRLGRQAQAGPITIRLSFFPRDVYLREVW